jgi:hypothetical protein
MISDPRKDGMSQAIRREMGWRAQSSPLHCVGNAEAIANITWLTGANVADRMDIGGDRMGQRPHARGWRPAATGRSPGGSRQDIQ